VFSYIAVSAAATSRPRCSTTSSSTRSTATGPTPTRCGWGSMSSAQKETAMTAVATRNFDLPADEVMAPGHLGCGGCGAALAMRLR
jgi:hypothetical protein